MVETEKVVVPAKAPKSEWKVVRFWSIEEVVDFLNKSHDAFGAKVFQDQSKYTVIYR